MHPRLLVLGGGALTLGALARLKDAGFFVIVADGNPAAPGLAVADLGLALAITDGAAVLSAAREHHVHGIMPTNDFAVPSAAYAAARLRLPGISEAAARAATDKGEMRARWAEAGLAQPAHLVIAPEDGLREAEDAARAIGLPCIVKPAYSGGGGRGVRVVREEGELARAFEEARRFALNGRVLVEGFIEGIEMTVESLSAAGITEILALSDKRKPEMAARVATDLFYPARFPEATLARCRELVCRAVSALGIEQGAAHTELIVTPEGRPQLVECGARGGGGHIFSQIVEWTSGVCMPVAWGRLLCGLPADITPTHARAAIYHFFTPEPGRLLAWHGLEEAARLNGVAAIGAMKQAGEVVRPLANSLERAGYLVIHGDSREEAEALLAEVCALVRAEIEPLTAPD